ncbi:glucose-1-phosphate thymidylyltransferase [Halobaculum roseum]|uniref:Glucose-1-phosphate thymidylyltransferase n=1 Tax=Halobaculum roseum TaxID=2175149 RepID=A0ABD5MQP7_9EURY|nr:glucose-1-phosphate thymidylyltransferase [Halobaculum roseum]QZY04432.1 glucose-1-phosphate thymidylyltransferase [Halobaculum roseum]
MLGVLASGGEIGTAYAPSTSAAQVSVAGTPVAVRVADSMVRAGVDELLVTGVEPTVQRRLLDRYPEIVTTERADPPTAHDRVVRLPATAIVSPGALDALGRRNAAYLRRPGEPLPPLDGPEVRPLLVPTDAFEGRPPTAAVEVARELATDAAIDPIEHEHVADVRRPWEYLDATEWMLAGTTGSAGFAGIEPDRSGEIHPDAELTGPIAVCEGATVRSGAVIEGPALVMPGATVGPNCYVRANSFISNDTKIGAGVELKNSVIMNDANVPHQSYVGDSVVGPRANVGAGSLVANLRHDGEQVTLTHADRRVRTGRRKFGAVIGEGAKLGIGTRLNVGTVVGANATTAPGEVVRRDVTTEDP